MAWGAVLLLLILTIVRLEMEKGWSLQRGAVALVGVAAIVAIGGTGAAFSALQQLRRTTRDLQTSERTFHGILQIAADAIISMDASQHIVHFNHGAEVIFGYSAEAMIGESLERLLPERFRGTHGHYVHGFGGGSEMARRMGERRQIFGLRRDGTEFPAEASISTLEVEGVRLYNVVLRDITGRVRAEESARFLAHAGNDLNVSLDYEGTLIAACHASVPFLCDCAVLHMFEPGGVVRRLTSVHDDPGRTRALQSLAGRQAAVTDWPFPVRTVSEEGRTELQRGVAEPPPGVDAVERETVRALGIATMITMPLEARSRVFGVVTLISTDVRRPCGEDEVALAESVKEQIAAAIDNAILYRDERRASEMRDELLGVVSHDLRNPLSAMRMCARVLAEHEPATTEERASVARTILDSADAMQRLIQDLLDTATIESGHLRITTEVTAIDDVLRGIRNMMADAAQENGVDLVIAGDPDLPQVPMDAQRIQQVLANLVANAVKFTERGGRVTVSAKAVPGGLRMDVSDTGIGIPAESLPHIFDRFWHARRSSRTAGTGLGLAIAKGIVQAHGGTLAVQSTVGVGSTFSVFLPAGQGS